MPRKKQPKSAVAVASAVLSLKAEDGERQPSEQGTNTEGATTESSASHTTATSSTTRKKKRKRKNFDEAEDDSFVLPHERKTEAGGYAHTNLSKSKISKANTGNTPWNKGRIRSSADRAKIASGVRARNRAQLLKKLKKLGLSEDEWNLKKKEIKYLRERVRRAKATNSKHKAALAEKQLAEMLKATGKGKEVKKYTKRSQASKRFPFNEFPW
jgi:NUMOD3 motif